MLASPLADTCTSNWTGGFQPGGGGTPPTPLAWIGTELAMKCSVVPKLPASIRKIRITITTSTSGVMFGPES